MLDQIRILDQGRLVATHPILEGRRRTSTDPSHRQGGSKGQRRPQDEVVVIGRVGERVARRPLAFYQAVGNRLATSGGRP